MTETLIGIGLLSASALGCATVHLVYEKGWNPWTAPIGALQKTFLPLTRRDFWLPPCPLCWALRAGAIGIAIAFVVP